MRGIGAILQQKVVIAQLTPDIPTSINLLELIEATLPIIPTGINALFVEDIPDIPTNINLQEI